MLPLIPFLASVLIPALSAAPSETVEGLSVPRPCGRLRLSSGGCVFVFAAADVDDDSQMALLPHFFAHYLGWGLTPSNFLFLVHVRPPSAEAEASAAAEHLRDVYGVRHTRLLVENHASGRDSAGAFVRALWSLLHAFVLAGDWLVHMELDEFVVLPRPEGPVANGVGEPFDVHDFFDFLDAERVNVVYGWLVDRAAEDGSLMPVWPGFSAGSIFAQFPLNCAATWMLRKADVRRAVAYRGYMRVNLAHHFALGVHNEMNDTSLCLVKDGNCDQLHLFRGLRRLSYTLQSRLRRVVGPDVWRLLPFAEQRGLPMLASWKYFASVFHFKWNAGLARRFELLNAQGWEHTSGWQQRGSEDLGSGRSGEVPHWRVICSLPPAGRATRALTTDELLTFLRYDREGRYVASEPDAAHRNVVLYAMFYTAYKNGVLQALDVLADVLRQND